uniref:TIP41-like protein n=1 Tax=Davidia involucrata TaxID=16924 RepID=A0A5B7B5T2_DAVIN
MADTLDDGEFWLPPEFLTDDDILMDKENYNKNGLGSTVIGPNFSFPTEFPYDFGSFGSSFVFNSPVESVVGSTETESDEEDLIAGLTRQLARSTLQETQKIACNPQKIEKTWVLSGSPQSTLSVVGSWSGRSAVSSNGSPNGPSQVSSPPTTPLSSNNDAWDLIYAAAGEVSRLKMNGEGPPKGRLLCPPRSLTPVHPSPPVKNPNNGFYTNQCLSHNLSKTSHFQHARHNQVLKPQCSAVWGRPAKEGLFSQQNQFQQQQQMAQNRGGGGFVETLESGRCGRPLGLPQSAWPSLQVQHQHHQNQQSGSGTRAVFLGGSGVKRECAGTGVFLPRRYSNHSDSRKKPAAGYSTALLQARVVQALNKNFDDMTVHTHPHSRFNAAFTPDYDALTASRNALLAEQRRSLRPEGGAVNHEIRLPKEWTY